MAGRASENSVMPDWYLDGLEHVWLPYAQMKRCQLRCQSREPRAPGSYSLMDAS